MKQNIYNAKIGKLIFMLAISGLLSCCHDDLEDNSREQNYSVDNPQPEDFQTFWYPGISMAEDEQFISSIFLGVNKKEMTFFKKCVSQSNPNLWVRMWATVPYKLQGEKLTLLKGIHLKVPFSLSENKINLPQSIDDINNFPIDGDTKFCELQIEARDDYRYKISRSNEKEEGRDVKKLKIELDSGEISILGRKIKVIGIFKSKPEIVFSPRIFLACPFKQANAIKTDPCVHIFKKETRLTK